MSLEKISKNCCKGVPVRSLQELVELAKDKKAVVIDIGK